MPLYTYRVRDKQGTLFSAQMQAVSDVALADTLHSSGYTVISISKEAQFKISFLEFLQKTKKCHENELIFFSRQLASLLRAGIPMSVALSSIAEQAKSKILKDTINTVLDDIKSGASFSNALSRHPNIFSELFISMVASGEKAGILEEVLDRLSQLKMQELEVKMRVKSAMTYPCILVVLAVVIVSFLLVNIIPKFVVIFETYEARLPLSTRILLGASFMIRKLWFLIISSIAVASYLFFRFLKTEKGRYKFDSIVLRMPLLGDLCVKVIISRFARTLGALIRSGIPILEALDVTARTVKNKVINRAITNIYSAVTEGQPLADPFKASGVFPATVVQMVSLGEKSGNLDKMLFEVAEFYEHEVDYAVKNLTTALEPMLLLAMGLMVAFIALSVLLPIFNLIKVFKG